MGGSYGEGVQYWVGLWDTSICFLISLSRTLFAHSFQRVPQAKKNESDRSHDGGHISVDG